MKVYTDPVMNMPWEDRQGSELIWRSAANPIIKRDHLPTSNSIFNSAVVPFNDGFAGVFRCDNKAREMRIHAGFSSDGYKWDINPEPIKFTVPPGVLDHFDYAYDPRVIKIEDKYFVAWCNGYHGPTIGLAYTYDFKEFIQLENALLPYNRNGVLFPRKINGNYVMLSRPSDAGHTSFGNMFYSESPDLTYWGKHRHVLSAGASPWQSLKIGAGPVPIETDEGWLVFYHGVLLSCNGYVYHYGAMLLDRDEPWKVLGATKEYLMSPQTIYECVGDVPNVVFPCAAITDGNTGRIALYYGAADTCTCLAFCYADEIVKHIKENSIDI